MLTQLEIKNIKRIASSVIGFKSALDSAQAKANAIDEKYRKMAEEKKGTLMQDIANLEAEIEFWQSAIVQRYGDDATPVLNEIFGDGESFDDEDMKEDVVVDPNPEVVPEEEKSNDEDLFSSADADDASGVPAEEAAEPETEAEDNVEEPADDSWDDGEKEEDDDPEDDWKEPEEW